MQDAVAIEGLVKDFKVPMSRTRFRAVDNLSFTVAAGEVYGLLGPNGSGKSTTMKMLLGLVKPSAGTCHIFGRRVAPSPSAARTSASSRKTPTSTSTSPAAKPSDSTANSAVSPANPSPHGSRNSSPWSASRPPPPAALAGYSKGMLQRIGLAQALVHDPRLIVLDEPTAGVDPAGSRKIRDLILDLKRLGKTVILSSHLLEQVQEVCDRVGILARGRMVREGILDDLIAIEDQVELVLDHPPPGLARRPRRAPPPPPVPPSPAAGHPRTTLESLFLDATGESPRLPAGKNPPDHEHSSPPPPRPAASAQRIGELALQTFRQLSRMKVFYFLVFFEHASSSAAPCSCCATTARNRNSNCSRTSRSSA